VPIDLLAGIWESVRNHAQELLRQLDILPPPLQFLAVAVASALTEEWAAIGVMGLARAGRISWVVALSAIFVGSMAMNIGLWMAGRFAEHEALRWKAFRKFEESGKLEFLHRNVQRRGWLAVVVSRFVPGTRVPVFMLSGILGMEWHIFLPALLGATVVWMFATLGLVQVVEEVAKEQPWSLAGFAGLLVAGYLFYRFRSKSGSPAGR